MTLFSPREGKFVGEGTWCCRWSFLNLGPLVRRFLWPTKAEAEWLARTVRESGGEAEVFEVLR